MSDNRKIPLIGGPFDGGTSAHVDDNILVPHSVPHEDPQYAWYVYDETEDTFKFDEMVFQSDLEKVEPEKEES
jgi:hypothetical protein